MVCYMLENNIGSNVPSLQFCTSFFEPNEEEVCFHAFKVGVCSVKMILAGSSWKVKVATVFLFHFLVKYGGFEHNF